MEMYKYLLLFTLLVLVLTGCATKHIKALDRKFDDFTKSYYDNVVRDIGFQNNSIKRNNLLRQDLQNLKPTLGKINRKLNSIRIKLNKLEKNTIIVEKKTRVEKPPVIKEGKKSERSLFWGNDQNK
jgi:hypothetical protein